MPRRNYPPNSRRNRPRHREETAHAPEPTYDQMARELVKRGLASHIILGYTLRQPLERIEA